MESSDFYIPRRAVVADAGQQINRAPYGAVSASAQCRPRPVKAGAVAFAD